MAAPTPESVTESGESTWTTSHDVNLGSYQPGEHLLVCSGFDGADSVVTDPSGWTVVWSEDLDFARRGRVYLKEMVGDEGSTLTITTATGAQSSHHVHRISGARAGVTEGTTWAVAAQTSGWGTIVDPPDLDVSGSWTGGENLWVAMAWAGSRGPTVTTYPTSYTNTNYETNRVMVATCTRQATADSENPATFTISASNNHRGVTIAIRDAADVTAGAGVASATATAVAPTEIQPPTTEATAGVASATASAGYVRVPRDPVPSDLVVEWDLDGDGDFDETVEDITDYVLRGSWQLGRDFPSQVTGKSIPGRLQLTLDNSGDHFNFFNTASPLNQSPYSLMMGRLIRIRTSDSSPTDPVELVHDCFNGNGALTTADSGETWTTLTAQGFSGYQGEAQSDGPPDPTSGADHIAYVSCGETSYYAQVLIPLKDTKNEVGLAYYITDSNNYGIVYVDDGNVKIKERVSGVLSEKTTDGAENRDHIALGVMVNGTSVKAYLDGVEVLDTTSGLTATDEVGLYTKWFSQRPGQFSEFRVWDRMRVVQSWDSGVDQSGVVCTMRAQRLLPSMGGGVKTAQLVAQGDLAVLGRKVSPPTSTGPDAIQSAGVKAGHMVGNVLANLHQLHPPHVIHDGDVPLGSVGFDRQRAISVARRFEETEDGFLWEAPEGGIRFDRRSARDSATSTATFTDNPEELGVPYESIQQRDWQSDVINQVTSEVSPSLPRQVFKTPEWSVTNTGTQNDVDYDIPAEGTGNTDAAVNDLMVVAIASTVQNAGTQWPIPTGWTPLRVGVTDEHGVRVFAHRLRPGDFGDTITFYDDSTDLAGGGWVLIPILVKNWYGSIESGVALSEFTGHGGGSTQAQAGDNDLPVLFTPWPITPTLFVALRGGMTSTSGATVSTQADDQAPDGFDSLGKISVDGVANSHDVGLQWCRRIRTQQVINPTSFGGQFTGYDIVETAVLAVRGSSGDDPTSSGGQPVTANNTDSQNNRDAVLPHPNPGVLFEDEDAADTYNDRILTRFDADRPILTIGFRATASKANRDQAVAGQLSDRVTVTANNNAGLGVAADYFIETIRGVVGEGARDWEVQYDLSPVADPGGGADN